VPTILRILFKKGSKYVGDCDELSFHDRTKHMTKKRTWNVTSSQCLHLFAGILHFSIFVSSHLVYPCTQISLYPFLSGPNF